MSDTSANSRSSHTVAWTLTILVAVPVLYLLTLPPLVYAARRGLPPLAESPPWVDVYMTPFSLVWKITPDDLRWKWNDYCNWWARMLGVHP